MKAVQQRHVPGFSRYVVTENGEVFGRFGRHVKLELLKGYLTFKAWSDDGRRIRMGVHQLVALAFLGPAPSLGHEVAHEDGDRTNNRSSNLSWKTAAENNADKKRHGTHQAGERHPRARLTPEAVNMIRSRYTGAPGQGDEMAKEFGVSKQHIRHVARGHRWNSAEGTRPEPVGHVAAQQRSEVDERTAVRVWCETCNGSGKVYQEHQRGCWVGGDHDCPDCDGKGYVARASQPAQAGDVLTIEPHFPDCETPEPSLSALIHRYYRMYFDQPKADEFAARYIAALKEGSTK